jgi:WD40 repeat protein
MPHCTFACCCVPIGLCWVFVRPLVLLLSPDAGRPSIQRAPLATGGCSAALLARPHSSYHVICRAACACVCTSVWNAFACLVLPRYIFICRFHSLSIPSQGHTNAINCVAWSPNGKMVVSGSYEATVRLWNVTDDFLTPPERAAVGRQQGRIRLARRQVVTRMTCRRAHHV